jgi:RHS repeat-associated protein
MIEKSGTSGATVFMQDEAGHLIGEYDGIGNLIEETIWLGDIPVATLQFGTSALKTYYVHTDHLNTPRRITNRNTNIIVWRWDSDPFGNGAAVQNPQGTVTVTYNLRFPGQYYQAETGLSQNYFRDFDPAVGRYVESDPIGLAGGSYSTYSYTGGNPISRADPRGLAYFAFRPLGGWPWLGPASKNPIDDYLGTDLSHEQLFFEDNQAPVNLGFFEDGTLKTEPNPTGYRDKSGHFNDCIMRKAAAAAPLPLPYCVIGHNCQTWADRVRTAYRRLEKDPAVQKECGVCK